MTHSRSLLALLQLASPTLPVGAYTYSEGIETLVQTNQISTASALEQWLSQELRCGAIQIETAVVSRAYQAALCSDLDGLKYWNQWLTAFRETAELREQSWQMGRSLSRLLSDLSPQLQTQVIALEEPCNFAIVFAVTAAAWKIDRATSVLGYLQSWAANLVNAGVRLIPLGQTQGQQILFNLSEQLEQTHNQALELQDNQLACCSWGASIASMNHETLYSRLFRS